VSQHWKDKTHNQDGTANLDLPPMQNLTSYSYLATPSSYKGDEISHVSRIVFEILILGYFGILGVLGYLATSDAKSDILLSDPDFL